MIHLKINNNQYKSKEYFTPTKMIKVHNMYNIIYLLHITHLQSFKTKTNNIFNLLNSFSQSIFFHNS